MRDITFSAGITMGVGIILVSLASANDNIWLTDGPYGARIQTIAIHPYNHQYLLLGTVEGGIYRSMNGGDDWQPIGSDAVERTQRMIRFHPLGPDTIYSATVRGIFKSTNAGLSWERFALPFGSENEYRTLGLHPKNPAIIMTGTMWAVFKSIDGGTNWQTIYIDEFVQDIQFDPIDSNKVYRATQSAPVRRSIFRSDDLGETWVNIHNDLDTIGVVQNMAIDPVDPQIIYLAQHAYDDSTRRCVSKTTDGGDHWFDITPLGLSRPDVKRIVISPLDRSKIYVCSYYDGVWCSTNSGQTWTEKNQGLDDKRTKVLVADSISGYLYLGTYFDGIYRSTDAGESWRKISYLLPHSSHTDIAVSPTNADTVYVSGETGLYRRIGEAQVWEKVNLNLPDRGILAVSVEIDENSSAIYVGLGPINTFWGRGGFCRSLDGGQNWQFFDNGLPEDNAYVRMAISYGLDGSRRIFMTSNQGVYFSDDLGESWSLCQGNLPEYLYYYPIAVSTVNSGLIFVGRGDNNEVYRSNDRGRNWELLINTPSGYWSNFIVCDPHNANIVYADFGLGVGLFKSTDRGDNWFDINGNIERDNNYMLLDLAINPFNPDEIFIDSFQKGVFYSNNAGQNWYRFSDSLNVWHDLASFSISPSDTNTIYLSTYGASVWSIHRTATGVEEEPLPLPENISLSAYPNPFNNQTTLTVRGLAEATVGIYDIAGRQVAVLQATEGQAVWDAAGFSSGLYFARLEGEENAKTIKLVLLK